MDNPISKFKVWWQDALSNSPLNQKSAVCVSTIDANGFPSGRFVDLKEVKDEGFVFCSYLDSTKGKQISNNSKSAMTFWWDHVGYQVRVLGNCEEIAQNNANHFWQTRSRSAQLTTTAFEQSAPLESERVLVTRLRQFSERFAGKPIPKPNNWGGYLLKPISIEFLTFQESRLHLREFYQYKRSGWIKQLLQP
jgi:pyridoxamine 5'-phosphate oxidase